MMCLSSTVHFNNFGSFIQESVLNEAWKAINWTIHIEYVLLSFILSKEIMKPSYFSSNDDTPPFYDLLLVSLFLKNL